MSAWTLLWVQGGPHATERHLTGVCDDGSYAAVCGARFLDTPIPGQTEKPMCEECKKIDTSGVEIATHTFTGKKIVLRPKRAQAHVGSLDPFFDIIEQFKQLGWAFTIQIAMPGQGKIHWAGNLDGFGHPAIAAFSQEAVRMFAEMKKRREQWEEKADNTGNGNGEPGEAKSE